MNIRFAIMWNYLFNLLIYFINIDQYNSTDNHNIS